MNFAVSGEGPATGSVGTDVQEVCCRERPWRVGISGPTAMGRMVRQLLFVGTTPDHRMSLCQIHTGLEAARLVFHTLGGGKGSNQAKVTDNNPEFAILESLLLFLSLQ